MLDSLGLLPSVAVNCTFAIFLMCFILQNLATFEKPMWKPFRAWEEYSVFQCVT